MSRTVRVLLAFAICAGFAAAGVLPAHAASLDSVNIQARLDSEGVLTLTETLTVSGGSGADTVSQQIPASMDRDGNRYSYTVSDIALTADNAPLDPTVSKKSGNTEVSFPVGSATTFVLSYTVRGATTTAVDGRIDFTWIVLGGLNIDVAKVTGTVEVPPGAVNYDCLAGVPGALVTCSTYTAGTHGNTALEFTHNFVGAGQVVQTEVVFMEGAMTVTEDMAPVWTLGRALTPGGVQIGLMAAVLVVGGLFLFGVARRQRTAGYRGVPVTVASFSTDADGHLVFTTDPNTRPGMVGTLVDSSVDPADILATILDLAVRGHLLITELPTSRYATSDWTFTRLSDDSDELKPYERQLLDALTTSQVTVSGLSASVGTAIEAVQDSVYQEVLSAGWFSRLPSKKSPMVLFGWILVGVAALIAAALLAFTTFALVGLGLVAVAVVGLAIAYQAHPVTSTGAAVYAGLEELANQIHTHSGTQISSARRYTEISRILPYAVVLGGWDQWLAAMVAADDDADADSTDLTWYHAPEDWHMSDFPASLDSFITVVTGRLFTRS